MGIEEFSRGKEDFVKVLYYLRKLAENVRNIDWWDLIEELYQKRNEFKFNRYFRQQMYSIYDFHKRKALPYDPNLINDLILLRSIGILRRNGDGTYEIDKKYLEMML